MAGYTRTLDPSADERTALTRPRDDIVLESLDEADGGGVHRFTQEDGPFVRYERRVEPSGDGDGTVRETVDFELPTWTWRPLLNLGVRGSLRRPPPASGKMPWWAPPQRFDARSAQVLGLCAALAMVTGYVGTLLGRTMTFAADEFHLDNTGQGYVLAAARIGGLFALALTALADRRGRRRVLQLTLLICIGSDALGALTPNEWGLAASQIANRGAWAASAIVLGIIVAEEMPAGARAYAVSLLAMTGALGAGMALWVLPVADVDERAWRILYLVPLLMLPLVLVGCRRLPESRRFERPHQALSMRGHYGRLALLAGSAFLLNVFIGPVTQFQGEFLRDERGFSAAGVALFALLTSTPGGIGIVVGGRLADTIGRRRVGAVATAVGTALTVLEFTVGGLGLWAAATLGTIIFAAHVPSTTVYGPELFPTSLRGRANGIVTVMAMSGSVVGLLAAGVMSDAFGSFAPTMAILAIGPMIMAVLIITRYPETARRELEDLNPDDRAPAPVATSPLAAGTSPGTSVESG
jgi:MFS family permease